MLTAARDGGQSEVNGLPLSEYAKLALTHLDEIVSEINAAFLKAFHPEGEEAHEAELIYIKMFEYIKIWFEKESTAEQMVKSIHRDKEIGISIDSISKFFINTKISLTNGAYDSSSQQPVSSYERLSGRKKKLLLRIIDTFEQLANLKFLMINLLPSEFLKVEEEIQQIYFDNIHHRYLKPAPVLTPDHNSPAGQHYNDQWICDAYAGRVKQTSGCYHQILDSLRILDNGIKSARTAIQDNHDVIDARLRTHNHGTVILAARDEIKRKISDIRNKNKLYLQKLKKLESANLMANDQFLETELPLTLKNDREQLAILANSEMEVTSKYNTEAIDIKNTRNGIIFSISEKRNELSKKLGVLPLLPPVPGPPDLYEMFKMYKHFEYDRLKTDLNILAKQKRVIDHEKKGINDAWTHINGIREKSREMAKNAAHFQETQLTTFKKVQANIIPITTDLTDLCTEQLTFRSRIVLEGLRPVWVDSEGYKNWKLAAEFIPNGFKSIYAMCEKIVETFKQLENGTAQEREGEAINNFIIAKRNEIENSLGIRIEILNNESAEMEQKIIELQNSVAAIQSNLNQELQSIYEKGCIQYDDFILTIQLETDLLKRKIESIGASILAEGQVKEMIADQVIVKEVNEALLQLNEMEECLKSRQSQLIQLKDRVRLDASEKFLLISSVLQQIRHHFSQLDTLYGGSEFQEKYAGLDDEFIHLESEYDAAFKRDNLLCGPIFLPKFQALEKKLQSFVNKINQDRVEQGQEKSPIKSPSNDQPAKEQMNDVPVRNRQATGFWSRHKSKIICLIIGFFSGAAAGAAMGSLLAPLTFGLSIPIWGVIFGIAGAVGGATTGAMVGSIIDCCLRRGLSDETEQPSVRNEIQNTKTVQQPARHTSPQRMNRTNSKSASQPSSPKLFQPVMKKEVNGLDESEKLGQRVKL